MAPGGSALYCSLTAKLLGVRARMITSFGDDFVGLEMCAGIEIARTPAARTTAFENVYDEGGRRARVLCVAAPLATPDVDADVVLACPVVGEVERSALVRPRDGLLGAGLQGWMRTISPRDGVVSRRALEPGIFAGCDALFLSYEDLGEDLALLDALRAVAPIVVCTDGARGADVFAEGARTRVPAQPADEVDPTGAGDVFAAAFLIALRRGEAPAAAATAGAAAAAVVIAGVGPAPLLGARLIP
jgi:sugar/nucleoside kinase (ribokinase family)